MTGSLDTTPTEKGLFMIIRGLLRQGLRRTSPDARADHERPLEERELTTTRLLVAQITSEDSTWAEQEAVALVLGIQAYQPWFDPSHGRLCVGGLAREVDQVSQKGPGGPCLKRLQLLGTAVRDRRFRTARRYLVEFGKLQQRSPSRLNLERLAFQAADLFGPDQDQAREVLRRWNLTYQYGSVPRADQEVPAPDVVEDDDVEPNE